MARPYEGVYAGVDFERIYGPKEYKEYPKHIPTGVAGKFEIAHNADEEASIRSRVEYKQEVIQKDLDVLGPDPLRERLLLRAKELDVPVNSKWTIHKLQSVISDAESALDALPPDAAEDLSDKDLHKQLFSEAKSLGINAHHAWGTPRLRKAIDDYKKNLSRS